MKTVSSLDKSSPRIRAGATDVPTFVSVSLLLIGVAFVASTLPAYFATKVDPLEMLRNE